MEGQRFDIIIGGGSFVGIALALGLAKSAPGLFRIAVVERMPVETVRSAQFDGRSVALMLSARRMLEALGVWERIDADAQPVETIDITDSQLEMPVRPVLLSFDNEEAGDGPSAFIVENTILRRALYDAIEGVEDVTLFSPLAIEDISLDEAGARATLDDGRVLSGRLLVAADGRRSGLGDMAGFKVLEWTSHQAAITGTIAHELPHHGHAVQHFLPSGPFAILPMTQNRSSVVWTEQADKVERIMALSKAEQIAEIEARMGHQLGTISIVNKLYSYPLRMTLAHDFVKPRMVLIGDAAHGLHWIAGQGLNHGLKDVAALSEVLTEAARLGLDPGDVTQLKRYERWRRFDSSTSAMAATVLNKLFANDITPLRMMRQFGLGVIDRLPSVKGLLRSEAAGLTGELPKLLRGELA